MADKIKGKITQIIGAVLDIKFGEGGLPDINTAIKIELIVLPLLMQRCFQRLLQSRGKKVIRVKLQQV